MINKKAVNLKTITTKCQWGGKPQLDYGSCIAPNNLLTYKDNVIITPTGSKLSIYDMNSSSQKKIQLIDNFSDDVLFTYLMTLNESKTLLATVVKLKSDLNTGSIIVYDLENTNTTTKRPRLLQHQCQLATADGMPYLLTSICFSHDNQYVACTTNVLQFSVLIFHYASGLLYQKIGTEHISLQVSFNPTDSSKLCLTGKQGSFKFLRFSERSVHGAPIMGLRTGEFSFNQHLWIPPLDQLVVAGTDNGHLTLIQGCEQKIPAIQAFPDSLPSRQKLSTSSLDLYESNDSNLVSVATTITALMMKNDMLIALSPNCLVSVLQLHRSPPAKGVSTQNATLVVIKYVRFPNTIGRINGLTWTSLASDVGSLNFSLAICFSNGIYQTDFMNGKDIIDSPLMIKNHHDNPHHHHQHANGDAHHHTAKAEHGHGHETDKSLENLLLELRLDSIKLIVPHHGGSIHSLCCSRRTNSFATASFQDASIRLWDYNKLTSISFSSLIESFAGKQEENCFHLDLHPSGMMVSLATESEIREYAVTDNQLSSFRKISIKLPFTGPTGTPHLITQPVSLVRYSNGGNLIAVVTGKLVQIFHLYHKDYSTSNLAGLPVRSLILCDHVAAITDLSFSRDDSLVVTTALDGTVYSWSTIKKFATTNGSFDEAQSNTSTSRIGEYIRKGVPATRVAISTHKENERIIVAAFENYSENLIAEVVRKRRKSTIHNRTMSQSQYNLSNSINQAIKAVSNFDGDNLNSLDSMDRDDSTTASNHSMKSKARSSLPTSNRNTQKQYCLVVWTNNISHNPDAVISMDTAVKSIALGESDGPDKLDICVLGLVDGRIIVSLLPFPLLELVDPANSVSQSLREGVDASFVMNATVSKKEISLANADPDNNHNGSVKQVQSSAESHRASFKRATQRQIEIYRHSNSSVNTPIGNPKDADDLLSVAESEGMEDSMSVSVKTTVTNQVKNVGNSADLFSVVSELVSKRIRGIPLDESQCKILQLHCLPVNHVAISPNGMWIITAGADGGVCMLATSRRALELKESPQQGELLENRFIMMDKWKLQGMKNTLTDFELNMEREQKQHEMEIRKLNDAKEKSFMELETKMKKKLEQREEAVILARNEYLLLKNSMNEEIRNIRKKCEEEIRELEIGYEKKLTQESLYMDKMKQAYDEFVVHSRLDLVDLQHKTEQKVTSIESEKITALKEAERQKSTMLQYFDFIKLRHDEVIQSIEDKQVDERFRLKAEHEALSKTIADLQHQSLAEGAQHSSAIHKMKAHLEGKELEVMRLKSDIEWANARISKLEGSLQIATTELKGKDESSEKWEYQVGELQQKIIDLERIRKALTTQLHLLRKELGPKEENLIKVSERLQEMDREYEMSLHAISEKEKVLAQKGGSLNLLQKQVRELRTNLARKEATIRRAATLFDEYRYSLQQAYFYSEKRSIGMSQPRGGLNTGPSPQDGTGNIAQIEGIAGIANANNAATATNNANKRSSIVSTQMAEVQTLNTSKELNNQKEGIIEIIAQNEGMKVSFKRLNDILAPFLKDDNIDVDLQSEMEAAREEQERHMQQLHRSVSGLRTNLDLVNVVTSTKVHNHLVDNQKLLKEVNNLRQEVRSLSMENQRLVAQISSENLAKSKSTKKQLTSVERRNGLYGDDRLDSVSTPPLSEAASLKDAKQLRPEHWGIRNQFIDEFRIPHVDLANSASNDAEQKKTLRPSQSLNEGSLDMSFASDANRAAALTVHHDDLSPTPPQLAHRNLKRASANEHLSHTMKGELPQLNPSASAKSKTTSLDKNHAMNDAERKIAELISLNANEIKLLSKSDSAPIMSIAKDPGYPLINSGGYASKVSYSDKKKIKKSNFAPLTSQFYAPSGSDTNDYNFQKQSVVQAAAQSRQKKNGFKSNSNQVDLLIGGEAATLLSSSDRLKQNVSMKEKRDMREGSSTSLSNEGLGGNKLSTEINMGSVNSSEGRLSSSNIKMKPKNKQSVNLSMDLDERGSLASSPSIVMNVQLPPVANSNSRDGSIFSDYM